MTDEFFIGLNGAAMVLNIFLFLMFLNPLNMIAAVVSACVVLWLCFL